jgi:hypothetical protein
VALAFPAGTDTGVGPVDGFLAGRTVVPVAVAFERCPDAAAGTLICLSANVITFAPLRASMRP